MRLRFLVVIIEIHYMAWHDVCNQGIRAATSIVERLGGMGKAVGLKVERGLRSIGDHRPDSGVMPSVAPSARCTPQGPQTPASCGMDALSWTRLAAAIP